LNIGDYKPVTSEHGRLTEIDGLRCLAVLSVIAFHFKTGLASSGFVGVDIFFVISGYVISLSLTQAIPKSAFQYILAFYKRRVLRIMPALLVCLVVTGLISLLFIPHSWLSSSNIKTGTFAFFGLSNFALMSGLDGYFNERVEFNPFMHTWSLAIEEQFYLFFPLLFLFWLRAFGTPSDNRGLASLTRYFIPLLGALSLAWAAFQTKNDPQSAFYMLPSRFWELAAGAVLLQFHLSGYCIPRSVFHTRVLAGIGILLLALSIVWTDPAGFPFPWALAPVAGTVALICVARSETRSSLLTVRVLNSPIATYLGRSSYSLYLWHWPVVVLFKWTVGFESIEHIALALTLTFALGTASYELVEKPFLTAKNLRSMPSWQVVAPGAIVVLALAIWFNYAMSQHSRWNLSVVARQPGWYSWDLPSEKNSSPPSSGESSSTLWVVGDSHARAYSGMVRKAAAQQNMAVRIETLSGCPIADFRNPYVENNYCRSHLKRLLDNISEHSSAGDIVFLASLRGQRLSDQWGPYESERLSRILHGDRSRQYREALDQSRAIVDQFLAHGLTVIIDTPTPVFRAPPFRCSDWFNRTNPVCIPGFDVPASELKTIDAPVLESLRTLKAEFPSLVIWDPFPILCPETTCSAFREGRPLFFDQDHLNFYITSTGAEA
jgi:peptidoglycan/LPS O-acetylase OafA/YrhL